MRGAKQALQGFGKAFLRSNTSQSIQETACSGPQHVLSGRGELYYHHLSCHLLLLVIVIPSVLMSLLQHVTNLNEQDSETWV